MQNGPFFPQNALFIHFSYEYRTFLIHSKIHSIVRQKYSFKEFIHSIVRKNIHSKNVFIQKIIRLFIQWKYSFFLKMPYLPPLVGPVFGAMLFQLRWLFLRMIVVVGESMVMLIIFHHHDGIITFLFQWLPFAFCCLWVYCWKGIKTVA